MHIEYSYIGNRVAEVEEATEAIPLSGKETPDTLELLVSKYLTQEKGFAKEKIGEALSGYSFRLSITPEEVCEVWGFNPAATYINPPTGSTDTGAGWAQDFLEDSHLDEGGGYLTFFTWGASELRLVGEED